MIFNYTVYQGTRKDMQQCKNIEAKIWSVNYPIFIIVRLQSVYRECIVSVQDSVLEIFAHNRFYAICLETKKFQASLDWLFPNTIFI